MPIWFALIIPLLDAIVMYKFFKRNMTWWELVLPLGISLLFIFIFKYSVQTSQTTDVEYWGGLLVSARYEEPYETWVTKTCSYTTTCCCDSKGNNCSTTTHYYDCSYCDRTGPRYYASNSIGETFSIDKEYYEYLQKLWLSTRTFVELNRDIDYQGGCGKDGDAYDIFWDKSPATAVSTTTKHDYENRVQSAHSAFDFVKVTSEDVKNYRLFEYPKVRGFEQNNVLGLDSVPWLRKDEHDRFVQMTQFLNGKLGPEKHARIYWLFFLSQPRMAAEMQKAYWDGGNDNELVICIGLSPSSRNIEWVSPFSWTPKPEILVDIREDLMSYRRFEVDSTIAITQRNVVNTWKRKDFKEFSYLTVEIPVWAKWVIWIVTLMLSVGCSWWAITNGYETDPDSPFKTITK